MSNLYARIGGSTGVGALVQAFYGRVLADPELAPFFAGVAMDKLRRMQAELFSAALGGPVIYSGRALVEAHRGRHIELSHYQRFIRHLFDTLSALQLTEQERYEVIGRLNLYTEDVVRSGAGIIG